MGVVKLGVVGVFAEFAGYDVFFDGLYWAVDVTFGVYGVSVAGCWPVAGSGVDCVAAFNECGDFGLFDGFF